MSALAASAPVGSRAWLDAQPDDVRAHFIEHGCPPAPPSPQYIRLDGPSLVQGRRGPSGEAVDLFDKAKANGGRIGFHALRTWARVEELQVLADELEHFGLATHDGAVVSITARHRNTVVADVGWRRWS